MNDTLSEPILGARIIEHIEIGALLPFLNRKALYRISWGAQKARGEKWEKIQKEYDQRLESMLQALQNQCLACSGSRVWTLAGKFGRKYHFANRSAAF